MVRPQPSAEPPLTDHDDAVRRAGNRPEVARELFALLQDSLATLAPELREAARSQNLRMLRETAHRLHGATLYCGVPRLRASVAEVERLCSADEPGALDQAMSRLLQVAEDTRNADDPVGGSCGG